MRYVIFFLMLCVSAVAAESTNSPSSLDQFSAQMRESYLQKDAGWVLTHTDTNREPAEIYSAQVQILKAMWGGENLEVRSVETFQFDDYKSTAAPGEFQGRKLHFIEKPTHWIVLRAESPKSTSGIKLEFGVYQKDGRWRIAGATYED